MKTVLATALSLISACTLNAQLSHPPRFNEIPGVTKPQEPKILKPAATAFYDPKFKLHLSIPAGWNFERKDGILSNFGNDTRTTKRGLDVRGVASIDYNPYPPTTFSGALFYYSVLNRTKPEMCAAMATAGQMKSAGPTVVNDIKFEHGKDHHGVGCTESRVDVFTTMRGNSCLRFDLVVNTFCASTSGSMEITPQGLNDIQTRLANILGSIRSGAN